MATIHTFTGNEVIATEVPKYLNDNFSALNTETANLSKSVVKTINSKSPVNGNINITGFDSYWEANEQISVGDIRIPKGRENSGYIFECTKAGTTGSTQPEIINSNEVANYAEVGRVGQVRVIFNLAEKDVDEVMAMGITYSRLTYPELWKWAGKRAGLIISEEEWQAKFAETNGKFVPYYSSGDGSSTFRTPLLGSYLKGAEASGDVGKYLEAGLPNITGDVAQSYNNSTTATIGWHNYQNKGWGNGALYLSGTSKESARVDSYGNGGNITFDASRSNSIYGSSDTVTPETMVGVWVIKAVGVVVDSGETDIAQVLQGVEQVQSNLTTTNNKINGIADYIVESYNNGTSWYRKWKSGWLEQGGTNPSSQQGTLTFSKAFKDTNYKCLATISFNDYGSVYFQMTMHSKTTTSVKYVSTSGSSRGACPFDWYACGQGA